MSDFSASIDIHATPDHVFALWSDPAGWPHWDPDLESATLNGPFETGSTGVVKAQGAPQSRIRLTSVDPGSSFVAEASLPGARMVFSHRVVHSSGGSTATHSVTFAGPLSRLYALLIGRRIQRTLPATMDGLKVAAEAASLKA